MKDGEVLVVEDDPVSSMLISRYLKKLKIKGLFATSGLHALSILEEKKFDFVIVDFFLPDINGAEVLIFMKEISFAKGTKSIGMSISCSDEVMDSFNSADIDDFLEKPLSFSKFSATVSGQRNMT